MTLQPATSVAFSVAGGAPADARDWIAVDLAGFPSSDRRGYVVSTEPIIRSWHGVELARQCQGIILTELRRLRHLPADEALGRALAAANGIVTMRNKDVALEGNLDEVSPIGVTAIVFEGHSATFAHVPPGQLILVEDGLVYTVPNFESWFPGYVAPGDPPSQQPEPLGYASWTAPLVAQTEVRAGDTYILCSSAIGQAYIEDVAAQGYAQKDLAWFHHRDPDSVLDMFRDVVIARDMPTSSVAVVSFPPMPSLSQVQTLGDVRQRVVDSWRHGKAMARQFRPLPKKAEGSHPLAESVNAEPIPEAVAQAPLLREGEVPAPQPASSVQERLIRRFEGSAKPSRNGWRQRSETAEFGVPGHHGVDLFRSQSQFAGEDSWKHRLPRLPVIGSSWVWLLMLALVAALALGGLWARGSLTQDEVDPETVLVDIDRQIVAAREAETSADAIQKLERLLEEIDEAAEAGAPADALDQRESIVIEMLDAETDVVRMSDVQRIGSLPDEFEGSAVQGVDTPAGVFFVASSLFQFRPNADGGAPELVTILSQGEVIDGIEVGSLWGVAFDVEGLYVTDGETMFMLAVESQNWTALRLGRINDQEWTSGPMAAFGGSVYLLQAEYRQIYRFSIAGAESGSEAAPIDWLLTGARDNVSQATDLAIDSNIFLLLENGRLETMRLGDMMSQTQVRYVGEDQAVSLVGLQNSGYFYAAVEANNVGQGRIVAFDGSGAEAVQLKLPFGFSTGDANVHLPFDGIQDVIVEESTGTIYIINADGIWTARYSLPDLPTDLVPASEPDATPQA